MKTLFFALLPLLIYSRCNTPASDESTKEEKKYAKELGLKRDKSVKKDKWLIVPGERVGQITFKTSAEELQEIYGAHLQKDSIHEGEGMFSPGHVLFPGTENEVNIIWEDESYHQPKRITLNKAGAKWHTDEGITIGTSLEALEQMNSKPFELYGFGWDYGGTVSSWNNGLLSDKFRIGEEVIFRLGHKENVDGTVLKKIMGEKVYSSDNQDVKKLNLYVDEIIIMNERKSGK